jgi:LacI family repressor for deo operon, udp, cdd, tsx, nupC, and nupG
MTFSLVRFVFMELVIDYIVVDVSPDSIGLSSATCSPEIDVVLQRPDRRTLRIAEVAKLAGVSTATVSRALTDPVKLRPQTLARVEEAIRRTGYTPNLAARNLRARRSMVVLVVVPDIANPFFADVLRGIEETLSSGGYGLLIGNLGPGPEKPRQILDVVQAGQVDGVLLLNGAVPCDADRSLGAMKIPLVAICEAIPGARFPQVEVQNREAARVAVAHLAALGHRRVAYLAGPDGNILEAERYRGFRDGVAAAGIEMTQRYPGDFTFAAGTAAAGRFLTEQHRPTALFAANDEMAIGFLKNVRSAGVAVPDELSIIGFDGIAFADYVEPTLTTFRQPRRELGGTGARLLLRAMAGQTIGADEAHVRMPVPLLVRASTGPAPRQAG